ncbi:MAG: metallophosphoesterase family protein [Promethearchaeota archaeon]
MSIPEHLNDSPFIVAPNLGCPRILSIDSSGTYRFSTIVLGHKTDDTVNIGKALKGNISVQPLLPKFENGRAVRGVPVGMSVEGVERLSSMVLDYLKDPDGTAFYRFWPGIVNEKVFGNRDQFFRANFSFELPGEYSPGNSGVHFLLLDLLQQFPHGFVRNNNHAVCITTRNWDESLTFYHATDLHVSDRNDRILSVIKRKMQKAAARKWAKFQERLRKGETEPLEERYVNINNNLRRFVRKCNGDALGGSLDLVVFTGDLIDFCIPSSGGKSVVKFQYENTNWAKLKDILIGLDENPDSDALPPEELYVPLFTTPGNHDYRAYHYSINWGKLYRLLGLKAAEAWHYSDPVPATPPTSIIHATKCLLGYWQEFSPFEDLGFTLGDNLFLVMDSGADSVLSFRDLVSGEPALTGFSNEQVMWLNSTMQFFDENPSQIFAFFHAPVVNFGPVVKVLEKIKAFFKRTEVLTEEGLKEHHLLEVGIPDPRMDIFVDLKHGTISNNWDRFLEFALQYRVITVNGHTHQVREFRGTKTTKPTHAYRAIPFILKKVENPMAIYYDDYSAQDHEPDWYERNKPFFLQTSALGPNSYRKKKNCGKYRAFRIRGGKIEGFEVESVWKKVL